MTSPAIDSHTTALDAHAQTHTEHEGLGMWGVIVFLVSESMIFLGLFTAYLMLRAVTPNWTTPERELLLPVINTVILVSSSFVIHRAEVAIKKDDVRGLQKWFGITALMGTIFLAGQVYEYSKLSFGLTSHVYASSFYVLTGFHGLHVFVGILFMLAVLWRSRQPGRYNHRQHFGISATELYWHFVDGVWIVLLYLLYIL